MKALVIGAYGHFGKMICRKLLGIPGVQVLGVGRDTKRLEALSAELGIETKSFDITGPWFEKFLVQNRADLVIHAAGVFRNQSYSIPQACIAARCYYVDLADDRAFVKGFGRLHESAKAANVFLGTGFGMTAVNMAILNHMAVGLDRFDHIYMGHSGSGTIPGQCSIKSSLLSCGKPVSQIEARREKPYNGLMGRHMARVEEGYMKRDVLNLDGPELDIVRRRFNPLTLRYQGGFGASGQRTMEFFAKLVNAGLIKNPGSFSRPLAALGKLFTPFSKGKGGLYVRAEGFRGKTECSSIVEIRAENNLFDEVKCAPIIAFVRRLMNNYVPDAGAHTPDDILTLADLQVELNDRHFEIKEWFAENPPLCSITPASDLDAGIISPVRVRHSNAA